MAMDIGGSFQFPTRDKGWVVKVLIGGVLLVIPGVNLITGLFAAGYVFTLMRQAQDHPPEELPKWDNWGDYFIKGLMLALIGFIYHLIPGILIGIGVASTGIGIVTAIMHGGAIALAGMGLGILLIVIGGLLGIPILVLFPMAIMQYAKTGDFGEAFALGRLLSKITRNLGDYLVMLLLFIAGDVVLGIAVGIASHILIVLVWPVAALGGFYLACVYALLLGNFYRDHFGAPVAAVVATPGSVPTAEPAPPTVPVPPTEPPAAPGA